MSDYIIHTETYEHKCGKKYIVEVQVDYDFGAPDTQHDCHGPVVELDFDPSDEDYVNDYISENTDANYNEDSTEELEERARMSMMRVLGRYSYRYAGHRKYYDVWTALKKAKKEWGHATDEAARDAVEKDFAYLDGWYNDDWHWCTVFVYALDEDGEKSDDYACVGGYESTIIKPENRADFDEVIEDNIYSVEQYIRKQLHKDQLELPLFA